MNPPIDHDCPFCRIAAGEEGDYTYVTKQDVILRTTNFTAFIGASKYGKIPCKILLIPNRHFPTFQDLPPELGQEFIQLVQKLSQALTQSTVTLGTFNWFQNGTKIQDISHFHFHILPRFEKDEFLQALNRPQKIPSDLRREWAQKIQQIIE